MEASIALYNTNKKELIGVFRTFAVASRYVFSEASNWNSNRIWNAYHLRGKLHKNTIFDFPVAVRIANEKCLELLGNKDIYINDGYPKMSIRKKEGVISCKMTK
jgi:hypothetical protein